MEKHAAVMGSGKDSLDMFPRQNRAPDLTVIVISTNEGQVLEPCLDSVLKSIGVKFECIVFNNASTDNTAALLQERFKGAPIRSITNSYKKGFIDNNNIGLSMARGRYVLLLNPDTEVQPDTFAKMMAFMDAHPQAAVATCRLTYRDGSLQHNVRRFPTPLTYFYRITMLDRLLPSNQSVRRYLLADWDMTKTQEADWFITAFFFMRRSAVETIGTFDQKLLQPFYCEDLEWCYRARLNGYRNYYVADTAIIHDYQQSSRKKIGKLTFVHLYNIMRFYQKHGLSMLQGAVVSV